MVTFSIITPDDELIEKVDKRAPNATERLKTMAALSRLGVSTALRFRPMFPGLSDSTPRYPEAYRVLIERAAEAGARAISYEVGFAPGSANKDVKRRWQQLSAAIGIPLLRVYRGFGKHMSCMRPPALWTENIMHAVRDEAHKNGMVVGVSDPVWKQLTDTGCCCGIMPDDPVFRNWEEESATNQLLLAKGVGKEVGPADITPAWAGNVPQVWLVNYGAGPLKKFARNYDVWSDKLREVWNDLQGQRGPLNYFQGALQPVRRDENGDLFYRYEGLKRQYPESVPFWNVPPGGSA